MERIKKQFTHKLPVKILCFMLFVVLAVVSTAGLLLTALGLEEGWFGYRPRDFYSSSVVQSMVTRNTGQIAYDLECKFLLGEEQVLDAEESFVNLLYAVYDASGDIVTQNCDGEQAVYVGEEPLVLWLNDGAGEQTREAYTVRYWLRSPLLPGDGYDVACQVYDWALRNIVDILIETVAAFVLAMVCLAILLCGAGRKEGTEGICLAWVNRKVWLDVYFGLCVLAGVGLTAILFSVMDASLYSWGGWLAAIVVMLLVAAAFAALVMHFLICLAARIKAGRWWCRTLIYFVCSRCWRLIKWLFAKLRMLLRSLPLIWKSVLGCCAAALINFLLALGAASSGLAALLLFLFDCVLLVAAALAALQLRKLQKGGEALARGDLDYKIDTDGMYWDFKKHAENLNSVSEGMSRAVNERMKSEHFKTELITNVSHDIKTPLTSIINYVDLLKKGAAGGEKSGEYLEVLERQSARLKKLTEDLVEASKASSGAINVELAPTDACELLRQAVGEYESRFAAAQLTPVLTAPERPMYILCDGRLLWRVFDNLLGNICKYSQPGTRAYMNVDEDGERIWIMVKNISRDILNVSADELMERFVRGDRSRSTEGSGLGLNIARSLTELQKGTFRLFVDGDLFKVILTFEKTEAPAQ